MKRAVPTRFLNNGSRIYKSPLGKLFKKTASGGRTYRPNATHFTMGDHTYKVKPQHKAPYGMKPKFGRRSQSSMNVLRGILSRRRLM